MKIYRMQKNSRRAAERMVLPVNVSGLKKAAGGEDIVILTDEAVKSFKRGKELKNRDNELRKLALDHVNDINPEFENLENDSEFARAEKLSLLAELVIRIVPSVKGGNIYEKAADFVVEQLNGEK